MAFGYIIGNGSSTLTSNVGSASKPIYINSEGEPAVCTSIDIKVEGTIERAKTVAIANAGSEIGTFYPTFISSSDQEYGAEKYSPKFLYEPKTNTLSVSILNGNATSADKLAVFDTSSTRAIYFKNGVPVLCEDTLTNNISGNAATANKLNSNAGTVSYPVYFSNGVPVICDNTLANNISGNAATATLTTSSCTLGNKTTLVECSGETDKFELNFGCTTDTDSGYVELATYDNGTEPIYVR